MKIVFKLVVVISSLFLELVILDVGSTILFGLSHGQIMDAKYRQQERVAAFKDYLYHRSPETEAKFHEELRLMHKHEDWKIYLGIGLFAVINGIWIYYYFRGKRPFKKSFDAQAI
jgi:hypothetical protein